MYRDGTYRDGYDSGYGYFFAVGFHETTAHEARLYVTSEDNAYGAVLEKWFDGKVEPYILKNQTLHFLAIELNEIHRLSPPCEKQSFYHCITEKLAADKTCPDPSCLPFTLTSAGVVNDNYQQCNSTTSRLCQKIFWTLYQDEDICKGAKCFVSEYAATDYYAPKKIEGHNGFLFKIRQIGTPKSSSGKRVRVRPYKTVNTEFYILDTYQLIGQIGGTLGLMIGFSFLGSAVSIKESVIIFASWLQQKSKRHGT